MEDRPVIIRACDICRRKKIRCEPTLQGCHQCTKYGTVCHFTPIPTKRKPRRPAGLCSSKYIAELEKRLSEVESWVQNMPLDEARIPDNCSEENRATLVASHNTNSFVKFDDWRNPWMVEGQQMNSSYTQSNSVQLNLGPYELHSHSQSGLLTLENQKDDYMWPRPALKSHWLPPPPCQSMPASTTAFELIEEAFSSYNRFLPLFDEEEFMREFQLKYSSSNSMDTAWWACLNVVLSIAYRLRAIHKSDSTLENNLAFVHIQNALNVVSDLLVCDQSLSAVRALAGMACVLQGTSNPEPAAMLIAAALRLAHAMNMHRESSNVGLTESQAEKRRRLFWMVYILDKDISLRMERPFGQDDDDMDVLLPSDGNLEPSRQGLFNLRIGLAIIQGQVYKELYSTRAIQKTNTQRAAAAQNLSSLLSYWKSNAEMELPEDHSMSLEPGVPGETVHWVVLRLTYIHCLTMIDRHLPRPTSSFPNQEHNSPEVLLAPDSVCVVESRKAIGLVEVIPQGDCSCVW
ncbi:hypothetical protein HYE68_005286 [Fusarium pseudograminearum]|nr:hypothetical protein HYE68_005286 [Fusarium pseudograminearum]